MKNVLNYIATNKKVIIRRGLIVAGTVVGLVVTAGLVAKFGDDVDVLEVTTTEA